jgi:hypothetical protein
MHNSNVTVPWLRVFWYGNRKFSKILGSENILAKDYSREFYITNCHANSTCIFIQPRNWIKISIIYLGLGAIVPECTVTV